MEQYTKKRNLLNNQNYIIGDKIKNSLIFEFIFRRNKSSFFLFTIFLYIIKLIVSKLTLYLNWKNKDIIFFTIFHIILFVISFPLYFYISYFYLILYIYLSVVFVNYYMDYSLSHLYIMWMKKNHQNKYINYSYKEKLIEHIQLKKGILKNNTKNILISLMYSWIVNVILLGLYLFLK